MLIMTMHLPHLLAPSSTPLLAEHPAGLPTDLSPGEVEAAVAKVDAIRVAATELQRRVRVRGGGGVGPKDKLKIF